MIPKIKFFDFTLYLIIGSIILSQTSCKQDEPPVQPELTDYSFFVAGHTYGIPGTDNEGLHPPFEDKFAMLNDRKVEIGVLTGDIVHNGTSKDWDEVDIALQKLDAKVYFAVGNHDMTDRALFESRYGITYFDFEYQDDLFIVLDPNIDFWNISGDQLLFLEQTLNTKAESANNVFVFFHQLLWWEKDNEYRKYYPNSTEGRADTINFWSEVEPMFNSLNNPVYMFAGDIGAVGWSDNFMYDHYDNISFLSSGMGEGKGDNFLIIHVPQYEEITIELVPLDDKKASRFVRPEDYIFP